MTKPQTAPAVFIDRDGTINEDVGYLAHPDELEIYPWAAEAIRMINDLGMKIVVVTNQSGVARGLYTEEALGAIHERLGDELGRQGARLDAIYYCPHHPEIGEPPYRAQCECRKPAPGMLKQAASEHNIDLAGSYVIGDKLSDMELAIDAGARPILVLTGYGRISRQSVTRLRVEPDYICENLLEAARWIATERSNDA